MGREKKLFTLTVFDTVYCRNSQIPTCQETIMLRGIPLKMTTSFFLQLLQPRKLCYTFVELISNLDIAYSNQHYNYCTINQPAVVRKIISPAVYKTTDSR